MKRFLTIPNVCIFVAAVFLMFFLAVAAHARAGGGSSVGRSSPSPSFSRPAPSYSTPRYSAPTAPAPYVGNRTTIIHNNGGGGVGSGAGGAFVGGLAGAVVGNALTQSHGGYAAGGYPVAAPVATAAPVMSNGEPYAPVVAVQTQSGAGILWLFLILAVIILGCICFFYLRSSRRAQGDTMEFDPLQFFYEVQQAAMNDDSAALRRLCTPGMAMALSGSPEPDSIATKVLKSVVWADLGEDSIEYRFTDTKTDTGLVCEHWQFDGGKLAGIEVR